MEIKNCIYAFMKALSESTFFFHPDIYERHKCVGNHIKPSSSVLDVGGSLSKLSKFTNNATIKTADIKEPADIIYDGKHIPVPNESFDYVTSIDVLEHIQKPYRKLFIKELIRIAKYSVIISAPFGTKAHKNLEKKIFFFEKSRNNYIEYLKEHIQHGLPTEKEINIYLKNVPHSVFFSGNIYLSKLLLDIHNITLANNVANTFFFLAKLILYSFVNIFIVPFLFHKKARSNTNRFYAIIQKNQYVKKQE